MAQPTPLVTLGAIHQISNADAGKHLPVAFEATVIYYRDYEGTMFVQDGDAAIYVQPPAKMKLVPGDRILIKGTTRSSFRPFVMSDSITFIRHEALPKAELANFDQLIRAEFDCRLVRVRARVRAADSTLSSNIRSTSLQMLTPGGTIEAVVDSDDPAALEGLLDADVEIVGAASGKFDGKMQQTGILIHVSSMADVKVLKRASTDPMRLPITPMDQILIGYHVQVQSQRMRVHGTITYYQPGSAVVLQQGSKSLWIQTRSISPLRIGDVADATGFPGLHDGFLTLTNGAIFDGRVPAPVSPHPATWKQLALSGNVFDLVSIDGLVVTEVREASQDEYVLMSDGQVFSAIYRHPPAMTLIPAPPPPMREIPVGSRIRVTGICMLDDSNPFNAQVPFTILMRSFDDIAVVAQPSLLNIRNLILVVGLLLALIVATGAKGWSLDRKVRRQTTALAARTEAEAALERRRSRILEDINGTRPLAEVLEEVAGVVSFKLNGAPCWCEITDGARLGTYPADAKDLRIVSEPIPARSGPALGTIFAGFGSGVEPNPSETEALAFGAGLATLAIETRRLYSDLLHRSEFDLLTDIHNRFSLDRTLDACIEEARKTAGIFGLIYIDLDDFKQVNDQYGHSVGDLYLQEAAQRMKHQLRSQDMLARIGGDEFAALVSRIPNRGGVEEIAARIERCFQDPFCVEGYILHGSASVGIAIYPEDGASKDSLLNSADAAMYVKKATHRHNGEALTHETL